MNIPRIAITPGEPAGVGPDIVIQAAQDNWAAELVAICDPTLLQQRAQALGLPLQLSEFKRESPRPHRPGQLSLLSQTLPATCEAGVLDTRNARYVLGTLQHAVEGCLDKRFSAMVTAPVQKSVINEAGIPFTGHTEFLAERTATPRVVMMLAAGTLRVALATTHLPLKDVPSAITSTLLTDTLTILHRDLRTKFGIDKPCIAVLGLNPHAGESGHLGREELDVIIPTLDKLSNEGMHLIGPLPADTAFNPEVLGSADAVYAMYHDQGLPVLKFAGFGESVNITLGLPVIRTSVDHGTALDLAGSGNARWGSLKAALALAIDLSNRAA